MVDDTFELYDLRVRIEEIRERCTCEHEVGEYFELKGGKLSLPPGRRPTRRSRSLPAGREQLVSIRQSNGAHQLG